MTRRAVCGKSGSQQCQPSCRNSSQRIHRTRVRIPFRSCTRLTWKLSLFKKMVGRRNGKTITAEEIVDLISISESVRSILVAYAAAHPSESASIHYVLRWRKAVLQEFAHLTGVELPVASQVENKPTQSAAAVTNISCRSCVHRDMFFERLPGKRHPEVNVKCAKGYWPTQRYLTFERNKKRSQEFASDCPDFHQAQLQPIPGA